MAAKEKKPRPVRDLWRVVCPEQSSHSYEQYRDRVDGPPPQKTCGGGCTAVVTKEISQTHEQNLAYWAEFEGREAERKAARKLKRSTNAARENDMAGKNETKTATTATKEAESDRAQEKLEELGGTRTPLALAPPVPAGSTGYMTFRPVEMTTERKDFLKKQFTSTGCTDLEMEYFIAFCERTGMDPVLKQAYLVSRRAQVNGKWIDKFEPMVSEAGMAAKADSLPDFRGMLDGCVYKGDVFKIDNVAQTVVHTSDPLTRGPLIGAWAHVQREGRKVPISYFTFAEKAQYVKNDDGTWRLTKFWDKSAPSQLLKCCRAEQWRQGWPGIFNGQFIPEEMREEIDVTPPAAEAPDQRDTTDKLADRAKTARDASRPEAQSVTAPAGQQTVDVVVERPKEKAAEKPADEKQPDKPINLAEKRQAAVRIEIEALVLRCEKLQHPYDGQKLLDDEQYRAAKAAELTKLEADVLEKAKNPGTAAPPADPKARDHAVTEKTEPKKAEPAAPARPLMVFGPFKNQPIDSLSGPDLIDQIKFGESKIAELATDKQPKVRDCLDRMKALAKQRDDALAAEVAPREPGLDVD